MTLYHGTNAEFDKVDLLKSKPNKDFGQGFYLSDNYSQAFDMAKTKVDQLEWGKPVVMTYQVDEMKMNVKGVTIQYFFGTEKAINLLERV